MIAATVLTTAAYVKPGATPRTAERTPLRPITSLMAARRPMGGVRQHHAPRWVAHRLADPLQNDEDGGELPTPGQRQGRYGRHLDEITKERDRPVFAGSIAEPPRDEPQAVAEQLAEAGDESDTERLLTPLLEQRQESLADMRFVRRLPQRVDPTT